MSRWFYVSSGRFTCGARVNDSGIIDLTAPILKRFRGQPIKNLQEWCNRNKIEITEKGESK